MSENKPSQNMLVDPAAPLVRNIEWTDLPSQSLQRYHMRQWGQINRSTELFCDWLEQLNLLSPDSPVSVLDICCGGGANTNYLTQRYGQLSAHGMDLNSELIELASRNCQVSSRCSFEVGDVFDMPAKLKGLFDGIVMFQTLFSLPQWRRVLTALAGLESDWVALSSLFWQGNMEYELHVRDYDNPPPGHEFRPLTYTIHRLASVRACLHDLGFAHVDMLPFQIDIELPKPAPNETPRTYTERLQDGSLLQISGPLIMPWYFLVARR